MCGGALVMARTTNGRRFFTVKVWSEWISVDGPRYVEAFLMLVAATGVDEARRVAWAEELESDGLEISFEETPMTTHGIGIDHVYDTGRDALDDFDEDPLIFSQLFPVEGYGVDRNGIDRYGINYFDRSRLTRAPAALGHCEIDERLPEFVRVEGPSERWFGVKLWRTWSAGGDPRFHEEVVVAVRARSVEEAGRRGTALAIAADTDVVNDAGEAFHVRTVNLDHVHDGESRSLIDQMGSIVFGQVFDLDEDGTVGYFDSENDLPFRKGALE